MDASTLQKIGLTAGETKVYVALLKKGSCTTGPIVDEAKVSRSKVYHILDRLMDKGLVTFIIKEKTKYFQAADPHKLLDYLDSKEKEITHDRTSVIELLPRLELYQKLGVKEEAEIYKGLEGVKTARELVFKALKKGDVFRCFGANAPNLEPLKAYYASFHRRRKQAGIKAKYIAQSDSKNVFNKKKKYGSGLIEFRYLDVVGPVHIDIFGDYVVTNIMAGTNLSFLIKNKFVADYYVQYFEKAWNLAKK